MKALKPILASFFALLVLAGSTSFSVGIHLCGDDLNAIALLSKAEGCMHPNADVPPCHRAAAPMGDCCTDEMVTHEGSTFKSEITKVEQANPGLSIAIEHFTSGTVVPERIHPRPVTRTRMPGVVTERTILFATLLI